ncbi:MAG: fibronectin type III domain-containing protein, partial [Bacteroidota bacterium]
AITASSPYQVRYRALGSSNWVSLVANDTFLVVNALQACTDYEFQVAPACAPADNFVFTQQFSTDGCCEAPSGLSLLANTDSSLSLSWDGVFGADDYRFEYRALGESDRTLLIASDTTFTLTGLSECTAYEIRVGSTCGGIQNAFSAPIQANTGNCACTGDAYCRINFGSANGEWIDSVQIGDFAYKSGQNNGYGYFPNLCFSLDRDSTYAVRLEPGYASFNFREAWRIWIDLNQDGDFEDADELVFDPNVASDTVLDGSLTVPSTAFAGPTRMRIAMQFAGFSGINNPESCESPDFGEFEDYCVTIVVPNQSCAAPCLLNLSPGDTSTTLLATWEGNPTDSYRLRYRELGTSEWFYFDVSDTSLIIENLNKCTSYGVGVQTICGSDSSLFGPTDTLTTTGCTTPIDEVLDLPIKVYPNPFGERLVIESEVWIEEVMLYNLQGQLLKKERVAGLEQSLDMSELPSGLYVLSVSTLRGTQRLRIVKQ